MITFEQFRRKTYMVVDGIRMKQDGHGNYQVPLSAVRNEDLANLPGGTAMTIEPGSAQLDVGEVHLDVLRLAVESNTSAHVLVLLSACGIHGCQPLSVEKFQHITEHLLEEAKKKGQVNGFHGPLDLTSGDLAWLVELSVGMNTAEGIVTGALAELAAVVEPLTVFQAHVDQESFRQLGI